jgi:hypothetical protein
MSRTLSIVAAGIVAVTLVTAAPAGAATHKVAKADRQACHQAANANKRFTAASKLEKSHTPAIKAAAKHYWLNSPDANKVLVKACYNAFPNDSALEKEWSRLLTATPAPTTTPPPPPEPPKPTLSPEAQAYIYKSGAVSPGYDELVKNPYGTGAPVFYRVKIFQYDYNTGDSSFLAYVTPGSYDFWSDAVLVKLPSAALGAGIDKDDIVNVWGDASGVFSYDTAIGHNSAPQINAKYVELVSKG